MLFRSNNDINVSFIDDAIFADASTNQGVLAISATFIASATNLGLARIAHFSNQACNTGTITTSATFAGYSINKGIVGLES